jgi:[protein-PII] uridylyltransferase
LELRTRDSLGLLAQVTRFFAELGIDVAAARLSTVGDMAVDTFYLTRHSQPLTADAEQDTARRLATLLP